MDNFPAVVLDFNRLFLNSTGSFVPNCRFSPMPGSDGILKLDMKKQWWGLP